MSTFYDRLLAEKQELDERHGKLIDFLASDKINNLDARQISLLNIQVNIMAAYSQVLLERIALIEEPA